MAAFLSIKYTHVPAYLFREQLSLLPNPIPILLSQHRTLQLSARLFIQQIFRLPFQIQARGHGRQTTLPSPPQAYLLL